MEMLIDVVIDLPPGHVSHDRTLSSLRRAAEHMAMALDVRVVRTIDIAAQVRSPAGIWIGPGSPYDDMEAVIGLLRRCREERIPTLST